ELVAAWRGKLPNWPVDYVNALLELGSLLIDLDRAREAEPLMVEALGIARTTGLTTSDAPMPFQVARAARSLGTLRPSLARYAEAEPLLIEAYRLRKEVGENPASGITDQEKKRMEQEDIDPIVRLYQRWGKTGEAEAWRLRRLDLAFPADPFAR